MKEDQNLKSYFNSIQNIPLLTLENEQEIAKILETGTEKERKNAIDMLIESNLRLVVKIAHDFKGCGLSFDDVVANGNVGLIKAANKYRVGFGTKFSTYAAWWIKQSIKRSITNQSRTVRIPVQFYDKATKVNRVMLSLKSKLGRNPTIKEIADVAKLPVKVVESVNKHSFKMLSIDEKINNESDMDFESVIKNSKSESPFEIIESEEIRNYIESYLKRLDKREKLVIELRFGLNGKNKSSLEEISFKIKRTKERVRQIQNIALEKLKGFYEEDNKPQSEVRKIKEGEEKEKTSGFDASAQKEF